MRILNIFEKNSLTKNFKYFLNIQMYLKSKTYFQKVLKNYF